MTPTKLISAKQAKVLELLGEDGEAHGFDLHRRSAGELKLGTIYVLLGRMVERGYLESRQQIDHTLPGLPRRLYKSTPLGVKALDLWQQVQALHA